jgi:Holliday junction resolvase-like predicted endonuclease
VLVEVKARRLGDAAEAVVLERRRALRRVAEQLLADPAYGWAEAVRFDVVAVDGLRVRHLADAF